MYVNSLLLALGAFFNSARLESAFTNYDPVIILEPDSNAFRGLLPYLASSASEFSLLGSKEHKKVKDPKDPRAFVLWHGLGDNYDSDGIKKITVIIKSVFPDAFVHSVYLNEDARKDERLSMLGYANDQVEFVCNQLASITELGKGFGAFGFSQGGVLLRAVVERCPNVTVTKLVTFGSPHMGAQELPLCNNKDDWICRSRNDFLKKQVWNSQVQNNIVPAQYFRDLAQYDNYLKCSQLLADLNNEKPDNISIVARERFQNLQKLVLIKFGQDVTLVPKESAFFEERDPHTGSIISFDQTRLYKQDLIGLKSLHLGKKIDFYTVDDAHMRFLAEFFRTIVETYFG